jgi:hypothetical protein
LIGELKSTIHHFTPATITQNRLQIGCSSLEFLCATFTQARRIENHIKRMKSRKYIMNLKTYPEMMEKLLYQSAK